ncbi:MAG: 16S rRNA (adenine(1518)-N(6)/adenine(1519)-N(6))-dimethyltransferase RsmA [Candidatus Taylorbacteria bacterium]
MFYAKKSLGQNFLKSKEALRTIIGAAELEAGETVLEVGPGRGALTEGLLDSGAHVIAVEKDDRMMEFLKDKFSNEVGTGQLILVNEDILKFNPSSFKLTANSYKLIANLPYYITGIFLRTFLSCDNQPSRMVLMLQKEVAKRIVAQDKKESILSISVKAYGIPKYVMTVQKKYFSPVPNVDSAILQIDSISKTFFIDIDEDNFFSVIKKAFSQKRKKVISNIDYPKDRLEKIFTDLGLNLNSRAEDLSLSDWKNIILRLKSLD